MEIQVEYDAVLKNIETLNLGDSQLSLDHAKEEELKILKLAKLLHDQKDAEKLSQLVKSVRPLLKYVSKAKAGKIVRQLVDYFLDLEASTGLEIEICKECIAWARSESRTYLRQALEVRLLSLYFETERYDEALALESVLLKELKKLDDKVLLVEVQLLESKVYHRLGNLQKARAALTSARTTANSIYCSPKLQASIDMHSGVLHASEERDFKTAYSYFYEAFEGYDSVSDEKKANIALQYMLMCKIMLQQSDEVPSILAGKIASQYRSSGIDTMQAIALAAKNRSLAEYNKVLREQSDLIGNDVVLNKHIRAMYDTLLGENLMKFIEPYSRVQLDYISQLIDLPKAVVEKKLSQMILDKSFAGYLDQQSGVLVLLGDQIDSQGYKTAIEIIHDLSAVVDQLYYKAKKLS